MSLFTALVSLTLAKTALRLLIPAWGAFSGPEPPLSAYTGFIQIRAAKSAFAGDYADFGCIYLHKCILLFPSDIELHGQNGTSRARGAERDLRLERRQEASTRRRQDKA